MVDYHEYYDEEDLVPIYWQYVKGAKSRKEKTNWKYIHGKVLRTIWADDIEYDYKDLTNDLKR